MPYADNDGIRIHYEVEGKGPPLVLHHGFGCYLELWYDLGYVAALKDDYHLILLDARGHGQSDKPHNREAYELSLRVADVVAVLDDLKIGTAHFWGYSMGGYIGWGIAKFHPHRFRSLIIGGGGVEEETQDAAELGPFPLQKLIRQGPDAYCTAVKAMWGECWQSSWTAGVLESDLVALDAAASKWEGFSYDEVLSNIKLPCMVYTGNKDPAFPLDQKATQVIPNGVFVPLPDLDHIGAFCRSDLVVPHIKNFLEQVEQANKQ
jgi:pimeloyl-ACP methyl ester carboxylesterase